MKVKYVVSERLKEIRKAMDVTSGVLQGLLADLDKPDCAERDHKTQLVSENIHKIEELKEREAGEIKVLETRAWLEASEEEPIRPTEEGRGAGGGSPETPPNMRFSRFGEFLQAVCSAGIKPHAADSRLKEVQYEQRTVSGANTIVPSEGGFLLQPEDAGMLLREVFSPDQLFTRCKRMRLGAGSDGMKLRLIDEASRADGYRHGGIRVYRASEGDTVTASQLKFRELKLDLEKTMGISYLTNELMRNAPALESWVRDAFVKEARFSITKEVFSGTGVGQALGFMKSGSKVEVAKEGSQAATTINVANVLKMWARMWNAGVPNAVWAINQDTIPQLFMLNSDPSTSKLGYPLFMPPGGLSGSPNANGFLLGSPIVRSEFCETLGTVGDIVYIDLGEYLFMDKEDMTIDGSLHVRFLYDEMVLRFVFMWNGMPLWDAAMTPYKGSNTVSPFITLATRS